MPETPNNKPDIKVTLQTLARRNYFIVSIVFFAVVIGVILWGIVPGIQKIFDTQSAIVTANEQLVVLKKKHTQLTDLINNPVFSRVDLVNDILYTDNPFLHIMYTLNEVAADYDISFERFEFSPGLVATPSAQFQVQQTARTAAARNARASVSEVYTIFVEIRAPYYQVVKYLHELENYAPFNSVAYVEINNSLLGSASVQLEILAQYYPPQVVTELEKPLIDLTPEDNATLTRLEDFIIPNFDALRPEDFINYGRDNPFLNNAITTFTDSTANDTPATP